MRDFTFFSKQCTRLLSATCVKSNGLSCEKMLVRTLSLDYPNQVETYLKKFTNASRSHYRGDFHAKLFEDGELTYLQEGGLNGDELREDLSLTGQSSPASKTSSTTANFQAMQAMFNDNQARLSVSVWQLDNSIVVPPAEYSVVEGSESTAPTIEFPAPPNTTIFSAAPTLNSQQATPAARPSYDSYLLATVKFTLNLRATIPQLL